MPTTQDYLNLITSEFREKPDFIKMVELDVAVSVRVQELLASMNLKFDPDLAVGQQLDFIGQWVGVTRNVNIPINNVYFSWDGVASLGWDFGVWQPSNNPATITVLPDDSYRVLVKAKIAANSWNGTTEGAYDVWDSVFPDISILIQDNQDMTMDLGFYGGTVDSLTLALITGGYIPLKPEGVLISSYFIPIDDNKLFAWDVESDALAGWDSGSWAQQIQPT